MRRRSIVGPLLLIALGALLLIHNIYPELAIGDYLSKYWPYLLIGWGVLRLAEIVTWSSSGKPLPARGVSGGEWVLITFLILIGSGMHAVQNGPRQFSLEIPWGDVDIFHERHDYPVTAEHTASKSPQVTLEDFRGDITVKGVEEAAVKLSGNMSISALDKDAADQAKASSSFEITGDDQNLTVRLKDGGQKRATRIAEIGRAHV